jgi:hypothetical protein
MRLLLFLIISVVFSGCYVPMPSVGVKPTRVNYSERCVRDVNTGFWRCEQTRRYVKNH